MLHTRCALGQLVVSLTERNPKIVVQPGMYQNRLQNLGLVVQKRSPGGVQVAGYAAWQAWLQSIFLDAAI